MKTEQQLDMVTSLNRSKETITRNTLIEVARWLGNDLLRLAENLEKGEKNFNSLGIVQGRGAEVDRLCGVLKAHQDLSEILKSMKEEN